MSLGKLYVVTARDTGEFLCMSPDPDSLSSVAQGEVWVARISDTAVAEMQDLVARGKAPAALKFMRLTAHSISKWGDT